MVPQGDGIAAETLVHPVHRLAQCQPSGIGAGAHGKITFADGRIQRYSKRRQPQDYMAVSPGNFVGSHHTLERNDIAGEFMMNALRLNDGFALPQFADLSRPTVTGKARKW
jgi:oxygen-independent coproporphyrinogen-3 oxidase